MQKSTLSYNPPWRILDGVIILVFVNILAIVFRLWGHDWLLTVVDKLPGGQSELNMLLISSFIQTGLFLLLISYYVFIKYKSSIQYLGFVRTKLTHWLMVGFINGIILFFAILIIGVLISLLLPIEIKPQPIAEVIRLAKTKWEMFIPFLVASVFAPVSEELYFRGFLYPALRKKIGIKWGIIVTSIIFGSLHFDLVRLIPLAFGGIWLNWLYERSGSIYTSMMAHSVWNGIMTCLIFFAPQVI